ncbi:MAG: MATE family efflux transporter, partial [Caldimonas sp.]
ASTATALDRSPAPRDGSTLAERRIAMMLGAPVFATLCSLALPNMLMMSAQAIANFLESYFVGLLGVAELAGVAVVYPLIMLMQMLSAGAIGGGISSAVARAMGAGRRDEAEVVATHAVVIAGIAGALSTAALLLGGRVIYGAMGGEGTALSAALAYSDVVFLGIVFLWLLNALASVLRGTGNMALPAGVVTAGVPILLVVSPVLIFGFGPFPALGIRGAALALVVYYVGGCAVLLRALLRGQGGLHLRWSGRLRADVFRTILGVGGPAAINSTMTNVAVAVATTFVGGLGIHVLAGFGLGIRLEYLLIPVVFGIGAAMIPMIGMNVGAGNLPRAREVAWTGALGAAAVTGVIGIAAAVFAEPWLGLFTTDAAAIAGGALYLQIAAPAYALVGLGLALSFASQGARRMRWTVVGSTARAVVVAVLAGVGSHLFGPSVGVVAVAMIVGLVVYAICNAMPWAWARDWASTGVKP